MIYCVSDLHGECELFEKLLEKINLGNDDTLLVLGDIIDKGSEPVRLLELIFSKPNIKCIIGNHEYDFLKYYWSLLRKKGKVNFETILRKLAKYLKGDGNLLTWELVDKLEELPTYLDFEDFVCTHAGVLLDDNGKIVPLDKTPVEYLVYQRMFGSTDKAPVDDKCVLFGHTTNAYPTSKDISMGKPTEEYGKIIKTKARDDNSIKGYSKINLDTGSWQNGILGCLCIDTMEEIYVRR